MLFYSRLQSNVVHLKPGHEQEQSHTALCKEMPKGELYYKTIGLWKTANISLFR